MTDRNKQNSISKPGKNEYVRLSDGGKIVLPHCGIKHDNDKTDWSLMPWDALEEIADVLTYGEKKYSRDNWKKIDDFKNRYFSAAMRHLTKWSQNYKKDNESNLHHLAHAACCIIFLLWKDLNEPIIKIKGGDDASS